MAQTTKPTTQVASKKMAVFSESDLLKAQQEFEPGRLETVKRWQLCWNWAQTKGYTVRPGSFGHSIRYSTIVDPDGKEIGINAKRPALSSAEKITAKNEATVDLEKTADDDNPSA